jgi:hypothetical protein
MFGQGPAPATETEEATAEETVEVVEGTIDELAEQTSLDVRAAELAAREREIAREEQRLAAEKQEIARREEELAKPGDLFAARIYEDVYQDGVLVMSAGTGIEGHVTDAQDSKRIGGKAKLALEFKRAKLASGAAETKGQAVLIEPGTVIDLMLMEDVPVTVKL